MTAEARPAGTRDAMIGGFILILIGVAALLSTLWPEVDRYLPLVVGVGLLFAFAMRRWYVALVFGAVLTGLGIGLLASGFWPQADFDGPAAVLGLGAGFVAVWLTSSVLALKEHHWWPLIPGGILLTVGTALTLQELSLISGRAMELVGPIVLLVVGGLIMLAGFLRNRPHAGTRAG
jgi:hypothetical protein